MVDVADASYVIEDDRARQSAGVIDEIIIGDGMAEAQEIKPDMVFLHEDGEANVPNSPAVAQPPPPAAAAATTTATHEGDIPTVTDVHILDDESKTKVAP